MGARVAVLGLLILMAILLKTTVLPAVAIWTFRPDVLVLVVAAVALAEGSDSGLRMGFAAGLVQDLIGGSGALVGLGALVMMGVGYAAGRLRPYIAVSERAGAIAVSGALAAGATLAVGALGRIFGVTDASLGRILLGVIVVGAYSAIISPLVLGPVRSLMRQFPPVSAGS